MVTAGDVRQSSPFFRRLSDVDLERLPRIAVSRTYEKGDVVLTEERGFRVENRETVERLAWPTRG